MAWGKKHNHQWVQERWHYSRYSCLPLHIHPLKCFPIVSLLFSQPSVSHCTINVFHSSINHWLIDSFNRSAMNSTSTRLEFKVKTQKGDNCTMCLLLRSWGVEIYTGVHSILFMFFMFYDIPLWSEKCKYFNLFTVFSCLINTFWIPPLTLSSVSPFIPHLLFSYHFSTDFVQSHQ